MSTPINTYNKAKLISMSIEALKDFDCYCKKNNLNYAISFGTELGCIRHGGFIPWDDDVDVDMPIEDYIRLKKIWNNNHSKYFLQTKNNEMFKPTLFYQLRKNGTTWIDPGCENIPIHWGIAIIDIFPIYHSPNGEFLKKLQKKMYSLSTREAQFSWFNINAKKIVHKHHRNMSLLYLNLVWTISRLSRKSGIAFYPESTPGNEIIEEKVFYPFKEVVFENEKLMGHANQDAYLSKQYGDYMTPPPEDDRGGHSVGIIDLDNDYKKYINLL